MIMIDRRVTMSFLKCSLVVTVLSICLLDVNFSHAIDVWNVKNSYSGKCLNVLNSTMKNGGNVVQARDCDGNNSKWELTKVDGQFYNLRALHSGQCLNVLNFSGRNGGNVVQAKDCTQNSSQWAKKDLGGGVYNLRARHSGFCLNVLNNSRSNGGNVVQAKDCQQETSLWRLIKR
ncbi:MAG: hypothetical protein D3916_13575 [Candidatus Electrothrix sp. MAN1_4]|nr:hypothetical protein [Candidatus Electrothrix sp. MAN1_4]